MAERAIHKPLLSLEEYLRLEMSSPVRHEYVAGVIHALAGTTRRHNRIIINLARVLAAASEGGPCRISTESVRLRALADVHYYPDLIVACEPEPEDPYLEDAPCLLVEVLSPSTEAVDRREKLFIYRQIPSLRAYLIVHQEQRRVERHWRDEQAHWQAEERTGGSVPLPCPEAELPLDAIYAGIPLPQ